MKIILASQSLRRKKLLSQTGIVFEVFSPNIPEEQFISSKNPEISCLHIARQKALKARSLYKTDIIIACDQMAYCDGRLFGKAQTIKKAIENLIQFQGKTHSLLTGLYMLWENQTFSHLCKNQMTMRALSPKQIKNYVLKEKPLESAGSYHIESQGINLFEKIETEDFHSIEGLPLIQVINQLIRWGYPLF